MIAATTGGVSVDSGIEVLKEGGTAADAAMTVALAEVVQVAGSYVSFAGIMSMLYYDAASGQVYYLDAQYNTPLHEDAPRSIPHKGGRTALVPGFMAGVQAAHDRFGKLPFDRLFQPAIALAEKGFVLTNNAIPWFIQTRKSVLKQYPETTKIFTKSNGHFYRYGDLFVQPELAETLKKVARHGAAYMYDGEWGKKFVRTVAKAGGRITDEDMKNYRAVWTEPLRTSYRDYQVFAPGSTAWGGVDSIGAFNLLELANLRQYGHYTNDARSLFWLVEIAACQTFTWSWHDIHDQDLSPRSRATKETAAVIWQQMQKGAWRYLAKPARSKAAASAHTDGLVVVDRWGNIAAVNHTINTMLWGETGLSVDGVSIPDSARFNGAEMERAGRGKRLGNGMSPLILLRDGQPVLACCATGGGLHPKTIQVVTSILDFDMSPQDAVDLPAFLLSGGGDGGLICQVEKNTFNPKLLADLRALGMGTKVVSADTAAGICGYWVGIQRDPRTGLMRAGVSGGQRDHRVAISD